MFVRNIPLVKISIRDQFWSNRIDYITKHTIPYQWKILNDEVPDAVLSHSVKNFRIAAGLEQGEIEGTVFQDSDLAKWIEAASYSFIHYENPELRKILDEIIDIIEKAQESDGYLDSYYSVKAPEKKWKNITGGHELYCSGHMLEAAVALFEITGNDKLLSIMDKNIRLIAQVFGKGEGKLDTYPGHPEIEAALMRAYAITGRERYLELAEYFVNNRGAVPGITLETDFKAYHDKNPCRDISYYQAQAPIREQTSAGGHAVRAVYFFSGAAAVAKERKDSSLEASLERIWDSTVNKRMFITGGIGSQRGGERFTTDYDLPNDRAYTETCAGIGMMMWAIRMLSIKPKAKYGDVLEQVLYNGVLSGISLDGESYFYVNPLSVKPDIAKVREDHHHVKTQRVRWFGCACCPPNVVRTICGLGQYLYTRIDDDIYIHLYIGNNAEIPTGQENKLTLSLTTGMPWKGNSRITISGSGSVYLNLRIPCYGKNFRLALNGREAVWQNRDGYAHIEEPIKNGDVIEVDFTIEPEFLMAHPAVADDNYKVAVRRGPFIYCAEELDNFSLLHSFRVDPKLPVIEEETDLFGSSVLLIVQGSRLNTESWTNAPLYQPFEERNVPAQLRLIPYPFWNNRGEGEMIVWMPY